MRDPYKCFYGSSYDRGLEQLLNIWPDVKKAVPKATLEIAYGWLLYDMRAKDNPSMQKWKEKIVEKMQYEGITHHGRLSQPDVEKLMRQCSLWTYPTMFGEINCINSLKAQAYGAIPVVINYAALETSVQFGIKVDGDIFDKEVQEVFKDQLVWALKNPEWQEEVRKPMMEWSSKTFPWSNVAKHWDSEFQGKPYQFWKPIEGRVRLIDGYTGKQK